MGNRLQKHEVLFMTSERTTKLVTPDGSRLVLHKQEVFEKDKLKQGNYSAERHNPVTGEHQHWLWTSNTKQPRISNPYSALGSSVDIEKQTSTFPDSKQKTGTCPRSDSDNFKSATCPESNDKPATCPDSINPKPATCPDSSDNDNPTNCPDTINSRPTTSPDSSKPATCPSDDLNPATCPSSSKDEPGTCQTTDCRTCCRESIPSGDINEAKISDDAFVLF